MFFGSSCPLEFVFWNFSQLSFVISGDKLDIKLMGHHNFISSLFRDRQGAYL
jgi:hypothetical protein